MRPSAYGRGSRAWAVRELRVELGAETEAAAAAFAERAATLHPSQQPSGRCRHVDRGVAR